MLPLRLLRVAQFIAQDDIVADIGSDHGKLPLYLYRKGYSYIYASENKIGPYNRLKEELKIVPDGIIYPDLADGLAKLPAHINTVVIAGMGGDLIGDILTKYPAKLENVTKLILAPNGAEQELRRIISFIGFTIIDEEVIEEKDKFYDIIVAINRPCLVCGIETMFGSVNLRKKSDAFIKKWQRIYEHNKLLLSKMDLSVKRRDELLHEQKQIENALRKDK